MGLRKGVYAGAGNLPDAVAPPAAPAPWTQTAPAWREAPPISARPASSPKRANIFYASEVVDSIIVGTLIRDPRILTKLEELRPLLVQFDDEPVSYCLPGTATAVLRFLDFLFKKLNYQKQGDYRECCKLIHEVEEMLSAVKSHEQ